MKLIKEDWEIQYSRGKWDYLNSIKESSRYAIIGFYSNWFHDFPSVLDVGCGFGSVVNYLKYKYYLGIDISEVALQKANKKENCYFLNRDAEKFTTTKKFDIIIFNEILYYLDAINIIKKYEEYLHFNGFFVISIWDHPKTKLIWELINLRYDCIDSLQLLHNQTNNKWHLGIFKCQNSKSSLN